MVKNVLQVLQLHHGLILEMKRRKEKKENKRVKEKNKNRTCLHQASDERWT